MRKYIEAQCMSCGVQRNTEFDTDIPHATNNDVGRNVVEALEYADLHREKCEKAPARMVLVYRESDGETREVARAEGDAFWRAVGLIRGDMATEAAPS